MPDNWGLLNSIQCDIGGKHPQGLNLCPNIILNSLHGFSYYVMVVLKS